MSEEKSYYLVWKGQTQGPYSEKKIRLLLEERKIHSLYKVQVDGNELVIREFLALADEEKARAEEEARLMQQALEQRSQQSTRVNEVSGSVDCIQEGVQTQSESVSNQQRQPSMGYSLNQQLQPSMGFDGNHQPVGGAVVADDDKYGSAVTSFVLSLLFVIPFVNMIAWVLSLIFGHSFLTASEGDRSRRGYYHAWSGVWLSYIFGGFFTISGMVTMAVLGDEKGFLWADWYAEIIGLMVFGGLVSAINSGFIIGGLKMTIGQTPLTGTAFIAGAYGTLVSMTIGYVVFLLMLPEKSSEVITLRVIVSVAAFFVQSIGWPYIIRLKDDSQITFGNSLLLSLFCTFAQVFIGLFILILLSSAS